MCSSVRAVAQTPAEKLGTASFSEMQAELLTQAEIDSALMLHNEARKAVGVEPLQWSDKLSRYAQEWANELAKQGCKFAHRPSNQYGENLFMGTAGYYTIADAVRSWLSEKHLFEQDPSTHLSFRGVGHYTQIVWRGTKYVGGAKVMCNGMMIVVFNYDPPGNYIGEKPY
ncbi:MAG: CAP domain-containing protein [Chloroherpetonaceae bacterium]|nr:CAP domain-containing protein [Chloroherpetonaceae bacterium]MDW8020783.1 CAP domain-containing protein [Chloroherpetonaceae bacterium]MDW8464684.1 CAP domain-containing protein [Chloroherpetonaceae bacterium]